MILADHLPKQRYVSGLYIVKYDHRSPPGRPYLVTVHRRGINGFPYSQKAYWTTRKRIANMLVLAGDDFQFGSGPF